MANASSKTVTGLILGVKQKITQIQTTRMKNKAENALCL